jgi:hypothetical protein
MTIAVGDHILLNSDIEIGECDRHGLVIKRYDPLGAFEILFADGVIEDYFPYDLTELTEKQWFKLQLGAKSP